MSVTLTIVVAVSAWYEYSQYQSETASTIVKNDVTIVLAVTSCTAVRYF